MCDDVLAVTEKSIFLYVSVNIALIVVLWICTVSSQI